METRSKQMLARLMEGETSTIRKSPTGGGKKKLLKDIPGLKVSFEFVRSSSFHPAIITNNNSFLPLPLSL